MVYHLITIELFILAPKQHGDYRDFYAREHFSEQHWALEDPARR